MNSDSFDIYSTSGEKHTKLLKRQFHIMTINAIINLLFLIVIIITVAVLLQSKFINTLNDDLPPISNSILNYLNDHIPIQIQKFNELENNANQLIAKIDNTMDNINNILNISNLNTTIANILATYLALAEQLVRIDIGQNIVNITANIDGVRNDLDIIIKKISS